MRAHVPRTPVSCFYSEYDWIMKCPTEYQVWDMVSTLSSGILVCGLYMLISIYINCVVTHAPNERPTKITHDYIESNFT